MIKINLKLFIFLILIGSLAFYTTLNNNIENYIAYHGGTIIVVVATKNISKSEVITADALALTNILRFYATPNRIRKVNQAINKRARSEIRKGEQITFHRLSGNNEN